MSRRTLLGRLVGAGLVTTAGTLLGTGCGRQGGRGGGTVSLNEAVSNTERTLLDLLLGVPPERQGTSTTRPDPPLLARGGYERVVLSADAQSFALATRGAISPDGIRDLQERVVRTLDRNLQRRGFRAEGALFGPNLQKTVASGPDQPKTLLVTLTPQTEQAGSPTERAQGRAATIVLIRLTITDPATGAMLVQRDYYSGAEVRGQQGRRR
jgi:hypothetical protein